MMTLTEKAQNFDWEGHRKYLKMERFKPMFDRAYGTFLREEMAGCFALGKENVKAHFLDAFDRWLHASKLNSVQGLEHFPDRDFTNGVTHSLDDLHVTYGQQLVGFEKEYAYHRRMKPNFIHRNLQTFQKGDVLVFGAPFAWYGQAHPQTQEILQRCLELEIPVHVDAAWFGCLRDFHFDYNHSAIQSVSFSLSKGLGLGSHRVGVRYSRKRVPGPVTIINDFAMELNALMNCGTKMMDRFGSDYLQDRYGEAYKIVCERLNLRPTKAIHTAFVEATPGEWWPTGIRSFLRYLVDDYNEFE